MTMLNNIYIYSSLFFVTFLQSCNSLLSEEEKKCVNSIQISFVDNTTKKKVFNYKFYEVTNYPEGAIMNLQIVSTEYIYKDSLGIICLPQLSGRDNEIIRKFVFVKSGFVYTEYFLKRTVTDTVFTVIKIPI
jgi:hypothetical protein